MNVPLQSKVPAWATIPVVLKSEQPMSSNQYPHLSLEQLRDTVFALACMGLVSEPTLIETHRCGWEQKSPLLEGDLPATCAMCGDVSRLSLVWKTKLTVQVFDSLASSVPLFLEEQRKRIEVSPTLPA